MSENAFENILEKEENACKQLLLLSSGHSVFTFPRTNFDFWIFQENFRKEVLMLLTGNFSEFLKAYQREKSSFL